MERPMVEHDSASIESPSPFLAEAAVRFAVGSRVLCLGGGQGRDALWLARRGHEVTVVDRSEAAVSQLRARAAAEGLALTVICAELATWEPAPVDVIVAIHLHLPPEIRRAVHTRLWEQVDAKGLFVGEFFARSRLPRGALGPEQLEHLYTLDQWELDLPHADFEVLQSLTVDLHDGALRSVPCDLIRVVAWKTLSVCALR